MKSRLSDHLDSKFIDSEYLPTDFTKYAKNQVNNILTRWINDQAITRKDVIWISIDWVESQDLDDALWIEKTKNWYCVWVHISDVSEIIPIYSPLDLEAFKRTTSIYRKDHIINMIPEEISNDIASLNEFWEKLTLTLQIDLDEEWNISHYNFYESKFKNLKRYDYESFWIDFQNKDCQNYKTLHLLKEVSNKLLINRLKSGWTIWFQDEDRRAYIWEKVNKKTQWYSERISHNIIESLMVLANCITWRYFTEKDINAIYKQHLWLDERSFYIAEQWWHMWLGISNYTHFTSPIRRYVDMTNHRIIKAIDRWEELPYRKNDLDFIAEHSNNTRLKIEVIWTHMFLEIDWQSFLNKTRNRLWKDPEVYDLKDYIREKVHRWKKMPNCMKDAIKHKIDTTSIWNWWWVVWVILFWKDRDLKEHLRDKFLENKYLKPWKILNLIAKTQILRWWETIFDIKEFEDDRNYKIEVNMHWNKITSYSCGVWRLWDMNTIKWKVRTEIISRIFDYFINL